MIAEPGRSHMSVQDYVQIDRGSTGEHYGYILVAALYKHVLLSSDEDTNA